MDFRELVKDLASIFHARIELRQIGIRDETKMLGGLGPCGRACCCNQFLKDFERVSIKMAKTQGLSLNPAKSAVFAADSCAVSNTKTIIIRKPQDLCPRWAARWLRPTDAPALKA